MKNLLKYTLVSALAFGTFSCTDLEEEIKGDLTQKITPANPGVGTKNNVNKPFQSTGFLKDLLTICDVLCRK
jgi:hypothetical protein